jgi:hypothetical protein
MSQRLSTPLQGGIRFLQVPLPTASTAPLAGTPASSRKRDNGFTVFRIDDTRGLVPAITPAILTIRVLRVPQAEQLIALPFWPEPLSIFGSTDFDGAWTAVHLH